MTRWLFHLCPEFFQWQFLRLSRTWSPDVATVQMYRNGSTPCMPPKFQSSLRSSIFARGEIFCKTSQFCPSVCPGSTQVAWVATFAFNFLLPALLFWEAIVAWQCESHSDPMYATISTSVLMLMWITMWSCVVCMRLLAQCSWDTT